MHVVIATHPMTPAYDQPIKGRKIHYAISDKRGTRTLCNMLVDRVTVSPSKKTNHKMCLTCEQVKTGKHASQIARPIKSQHKYSFTINTDASVDPKTGTGAWAYWIRSSNFLFKDSGLFPAPVANSSVAELLAFEKALEAVDRSVGSDRRNIKLYVNTDSMWTIQALKGEVKKSKYKELAARVRELTIGYELDLRHVKAHRDTSSARTWVNDWLDKAAKFHVRNELRRRQMLKDLKENHGP